MAIKDRFIHTRHGRIHALEAGSGTPLILLHTLGGSSYQFIETLPLLAERHHALALDMVGHGDSDPLAHHLSMEQHAEAIIDVADQLGAARVNVFGQSVGGYLAAALAANWKSRIGKSIVGEAPPRVMSDYVEGWAAAEAMWANVNNTFEEVRPRMRELTPAVFQRWNIDRNKAGAKTLMLTYWAIREFDFVDAIRRSEVPTMMLLGEKSMAAQLANYQKHGMTRFPVKVMPNCGHFLSLDDSKLLAQIVDQFVYV